MDEGGLLKDTVSPLSVIHHCLSFPIVIIYLVFPIVCKFPLSVIPLVCHSHFIVCYFTIVSHISFSVILYFLSFPMVGHSPLFATIYHCLPSLSIIWYSPLSVCLICLSFTIVHQWQLSFLPNHCSFPHYMSFLIVCHCLSFSISHWLLFISVAQPYNNGPAPVCNDHMVIWSQHVFPTQYTV